MMTMRNDGVPRGACVVCEPKREAGSVDPVDGRVQSEADSL